jgi:hypothetical protein
MRFALVEGQRSIATPSSVAACPYCGRGVHSKCGEVLAWHWAHVAQRRCDPWWESETEWHREWKARFPKDLQEVIHHDGVTGEKHVADVKTKLGIAIEFQHSSMTPGELRSREEFYGRMLWVVDGGPFRHTFHILAPLPPPRSDLAHRLRILQVPTPERPRGMFLLSEHELRLPDSNTVFYDTSFLGSNRSATIMSLTPRPL